MKKDNIDMRILFASRALESPATEGFVLLIPYEHFNKEDLIHDEQ